MKWWLSLRKSFRFYPRPLPPGGEGEGGKVDYLWLAGIKVVYAFLDEKE